MAGQCAPGVEDSIGRVYGQSPRNGIKFSSLELKRLSLANQRSGPIKGYVETLESRLAVTENALLRLLSVVDENIIESAFQNNDRSVRYTPRLSTIFSDMSAGPVEASKASLVAHWRDFPLETANEVRQWAEEVMRDQSASLAEISTNREQDTFPVPPIVSRPSNQNAAALPTHVTSHDEASTEGTLIEDTSASMPEWEALLFAHQMEESSSNTQHMSSRISSDQLDDNKKNTFTLSDDFKKQYIW